MMRNKLILYFVFILFTGTHASAQSTLDKLILEEAQTAYANGQYSLCLEKLDELEKKGSKGLVLAHLKIMATSKLPESHLSYWRVVQLKKDVEYYLKNYDNEDFLPQYKEVYEVSKTLFAPKYDEASLCVKQGDTYYKAKLYENALEWYLKAGNYAEYNNLKLFERIGHMYYYGQGTEKDDKKAFEWYSKSANQGSAMAQNFIGSLYYKGEGVEKNDIKAIEWYTKAASQGDAFGQANLGNMYYYGHGVEKDFTKAIEWYEKAANQGNAYSQNRLGVMYSNGLGTEEDKNKAFEWYTKAANQGNVSAQHALGLLYANGEGVEKDLDKAIEWYKKAVEQGNWLSFYSLAHCYVQNNNHQQLILLCEKVIADSKFKQTEKASAMQMLGESYSKGNGVPKDISKAIEWYTKAANEGSTEAMYHLGLLYYDGTDISQDYAKAVEWVRKAADKGYVMAMVDMGILYEVGKAIAQDYTLAKQWYEKAAEKGSLTAMNNIGRLYANGYGVEQDYKKAMEWFQKAADKGLVNAIGNIGQMYYEGKGVTKDYAVALQYFERAEQKIKNNPSLYDMMADSYLETDNKDKAKEYYQKAADLGSEKAIEWLKNNK